MSEDEYRLLHGLSINSGKLGLALYSRDEFAKYERNGWLKYRDDGVVPYMELTYEGLKALSDAWTDRQPPTVTPL